jgi:hypothetical protein
MSRTWTRQRVVDEIRDWHARGVAVRDILRQDQSLRSAAYRHWGSWRAALRAAGFESSQPRYTKETLIQVLRTRAAGSNHNSHPQKNLAGIKTTAARHFGSWHRALVAAGLRTGPPPTQHAWTRDEVVEAIRIWKSLSPRLRKLLPYHRTIQYVAKRLFGSWRQALMAAGFEPKRLTYWSRDEVLQCIRSRLADGLKRADVYRMEPRLVAAATRYYGSWGKALRELGVETKACQRWDKLRIIAEIQQRHQAGPPLSCVWKDERLLFRAAIRHFGGWRNALRAAGLEAKPFRKWSAEQVLDELREQYRKQPCAVSSADPYLACLAARYFGSVVHALESAGLEPPPSRWTARRILESIQDGFVQAKPIRTAGFGSKPLAEAAKRYFGNWRAAVAAAGLAAHLPLAKATRCWTPQAVVDEIRRRHRDGDRVTELWRLDTSLYSMAKKYFGTWLAAVQAAGLQPTHRRWTREIVIDELQHRHASGKSLSSGAVARDDPGFAGAVLRFFDSWPKARTAAGLPALVSAIPRRNHRKGKTACRETK